MKKRVWILLVALLLGTAMLFAACSAYGKIEKAFTDAGYEKSETLESVTKSIQEELEAEELAVTFHAFTKGLNVALVIEFKSTEDMDQAVENSAALKGAVQDLYKAGEDCDIVNENCLLVPIGVNAKDMIEIFKNA